MANEELKIQNVNRTLETAYNLFLEHGIESVTREMIARESGLSRKSIERYFSNQVECVIRVAEWVLMNIRSSIGSRYPERFFTDGKHTGAQLLKSYMIDIKRLFFRNPRIFVLYSEYKLYIYRHCEDFEQSYSLLCDWKGNRQVRQKIFLLGKKDGTMASNINVNTEEEYFSESFFGFLANLAMSFGLHQISEAEKQIDQRIENTLALYGGKNSPIYKNIDGE
jgi:AcrR family transcriptional regulator